jgi:hypothetical protein
MAINPNTDFTTGAVLTADQQNRFPRGVVAYAETTTSDTTITAEEIQVTSTSFTAVANRYYRITYYEPQMAPASGGFAVAYIRKTNLAGTELERGLVQSPSGAALNATLCVSVVTTFSAGSTVVIGSIASGSGTSTASRGATYPAWICVEDIGPA